MAKKILLFLVIFCQQFQFHFLFPNFQNFGSSSLLIIDEFESTLNSTCAESIFEQCRRENNDYLARIKNHCCVGAKRIKCLQNRINECDDLNETINKSLLPFVQIMCKRQNETLATACSINRDEVIMFVIGLLISISLISLIVFYALKTYIF